MAIDVRIAAGRERGSADRRQRTGAGVDGIDRDVIGELIRNVGELTPRIDRDAQGKVSGADRRGARSRHRSRA